jgi:hypothetical protein
VTLCGSGKVSNFAGLGNMNNNRVLSSHCAWDI